MERTSMENMLHNKILNFRHSLQSCEENISITLQTYFFLEPHFFDLLVNGKNDKLKY